MLIICAFISATLLSVAHSAQTRHHPMQELERAKRSKNPGAVVYQNTCSQCHAVNASIPVGAPRFRQLNDWQPRLKKGYPALLANLMHGLNMMPPRGGCFECSDALLEQATRYMLPKKLKQKPHKTSDA